MSHHKARSEKVCLNCGTAPLHDLYCHHCGQENVEPRQTLGHLLVHFFNDITHFDGKFFATLKLLILKPGYLSAEYIQGRRVKYLDPIRMYLFISALFLFVFLYAIGTPKQVLVKKDRQKMATIDSLRITERLDGFNVVFSSSDGEQHSILNVNEEHRHGMAYYDSVQHSLPAGERDNWWQEMFSRKAVRTYQVYDDDPYNFFPRATEKFLHSFSKIFFISLPIFAFVLLLLYIRRKQFYYVSHLIFSLHYYCVLFIFSIVMALVLKAFPENWVIGIFALGFSLYLLIAMRGFYRQNWFKTFFKFLTLSVIMSLVLLILTLGLWLNSVMSMGS